MRARLALSALLLGLASARPAAAEPSVWQRVRDPELARSEELAVRLERFLSMGALGDGERRPQVMRDFALGAVAAADLAGASRMPGARLACVFGEALLLADLSRRARDVLAKVVDDLPPGPLAADCLFSYGLALAHLGELEAEIGAFTRALSYADERNFRANLHYNRAESRMALGDLAGAVDDYLTAIGLTSREQLRLLCHYGLAVALDRRGDLPAAWGALDTAHRSHDPFGPFPGADPLDSPSVFFVPAYDEHYYRALSRMAAARRASSPEDVREHYERALEHWDAYLRAAEAASGRWIEQGRLHALRCRRALDELSTAPKRARKRR